MTAQSGGTSEREQRLQAVLVAILEAAERGRALDAADQLARHPEFAAELEEFLANRAQVDRLALPLRQLAEAAQAEVAARRTVGSDGAAAEVGPGTRVRYFGDYELLEEIARGGMGVVYRARQVSLNRVVALKMILRGELATEADVRRFRQEAEAAANLDHPNIVPIYEVGEQERQQYFSMKLIETQAAGRSLTPLEAAGRLAKVARAVHRAHQRGILHRDLKPSNILIDTSGEPHVVDFGLARKVEGGDSTRTGAIVGTPAYMAPEQARAEKSLTTAVDVYSLGAVLYEWLVGQPPFRGEDPLSILMKVVNEEPPRPRLKNPAVDRDLETICLRCLDKDPAKRYGSAEALADDLDRWRRHEPIVARRASPLERLVKWARREPGAAVFVAFTAFSLASFITMLLYFVISLNEAIDAEFQARQQALQAAHDAQMRELDAQSALNRERRTAYTQRVLLAQRELLADNVLRADQLLDQCPESLRGWEWHYLRRLCHGEVYALPLADRIVTELFLTTDGRQLLALDDRGTVAWHDARTGRELGRRAVVSGKVGRAAFSPDGRLLATAEEGPMVHLWDLDTGTRTATLKGHEGKVYHLVFSPDGSRLASAGADPFVLIWDVAGAREEQRLEGHVNRHIQHVAFSPDGQRLVSASGEIGGLGEVKVWDLTTGKVARDLVGHREVVFAAAFSPDGSRIATGGWDRTVRIWDAATGQEVAAARGIQHLVSRLIFTPNGSSLIVSGEHEVIRVLDARTGVETARVRGHRYNVVALALGPDGQTLAAAAAHDVKAGHRTEGEIKLWNLAQGQECRTDAFPALQAAFSPDGRLLAAVPMLKNHALVVDAATGLQVYRLEGHDSHVSAIAFTPDGSQIVTGAGSLINAGSSTETADRKSRAKPGQIVFWETATGKKLRTLTAEEGVIDALVFRHGGEHLATVSRDGIVRLRAVATGEVFRTFVSGETGKLSQPVLSPDGTILAAWCTDRTIHLFDVDSGERRAILRGHRHALGRLAFSPQGRSLASSSFEPRTIVNNADARDTSPGELKLWDVATGREITPFASRVEPISDLTFSPDGKRLATAGTSGAVQLWDVETGQETLILRGHTGGVESVAFSKDGHRLASTSWLPRILMAGPGELKVWDATPVSAAPQPERLAAALVAGLFARHGLSGKVQAELQGDTTLDAGVHAAALEIACSLNDDEYQLNDLAWEVVRVPARPQGEYLRAVALMEAALRRQPGHRNFLNTLGVAQYRAGQFEEARGTLTRSLELNEKAEGRPHPCDVAFMALACHRLKLDEDARRHRDRLRELMKRPEFARAEDEQSFLREVEQALERPEKR